MTDTKSDVINIRIDLYYVYNIIDARENHNNS